MSYDLAVWEGELPASDAEAAGEFMRLAEHWLEAWEREDGGDELIPTPAITRYVDALLQRWPDIDDDEDSPWASGLTGDAAGPIIQINIRPSR